MASTETSSVSETAGEFWGDIVGEYDSLIRRLVSPYPAMVKTLFHYLPQDFYPSQVLELGSGTGNLTKVMRERWPQAHITAVDVSSVMLEQTKQKVGSASLKLIESKFEDLQFEDKSFDYIVSSLALHHLPKPDFQKFIKNTFSWLQSGGYWGIIDGIRAESNRLYDRANEYWIELSKANGITDEEMVEQLRHHKMHDHYPVLIDLACDLKEIGFVEVDILWRDCIWAVLQGKKIN